MKSQNKGIRKVFAISMVATFLSPIFLSSAVSAAEASSDATSIVEKAETSQGSLEELETSTVQGEELADSSETNSEIVDIENEVVSPEEIYSVEETREKAIEMMEQDQVANDTYSVRTSSVSKTTAFINSISGYAVSVAEKNNLYASVMIAQAALESAWGTSILAYNPNFNLFGVKGSYNGQTFYKYTKEYSEKDGWSTIKAGFRKYPSYAESLNDYGDKLRNGPATMNSDFYKGTWKENAKTYQDATAWLTGRYATDPSYNTKLNSIIQTYNLDTFDKTTLEDVNPSNSDLQSDLTSTYSDEVVATNNVNYIAYINAETDGIYSAPKYTKDSKVNSTTMEYFDKKVTVTQEKKTKNGLTWTLISLSGQQLGWIDKSGLDLYETIRLEKNINYVAKINRGTDTINTQPYGTKDSKIVGKSSEYLNEKVTITKEAVTDRATWALVSIGKKEIGWIDKAALDIEKVTSEKAVSYTAVITRGNDSIGSKPYGTEGYTTKAKSDTYLNKEVKVVKEATTRRATWALITLNGEELGWIDKKALTSYESVLSQKEINYAAKIVRGTDTINTEPYGTVGSKKVAKSSDYLNAQVNITKEKVTDRATWALVSIGKKEIGWIDKAALDIEKVTSEKSVSYTRFINRATDTITSKPYGTEGYEIVNKSKNYFGEQVKVLKEAKTRRATWVLISINDKEIGWIDQGALTTNEVIISEKEINYVATINRGTDTINTNPYGTFESKYVAHSSKYLNKQVKVIKEAVTGRATWALISVGGKQIGWIDKEALNIEKVTSEKSVQYTRYISRMTDGINTKPYGTEGYSTVAKSSAYFGKKVQVIKEATTQRATWALISIDGKQLGWIDKAALSEFEVIISEKEINYYALIKRDSDSITTKPYGTKDYETITKSSQYLNKEVKITKEAVTDRATWAYITINGKNVGWIDKAALDIERVTSETNVADYKARIIRKGDSISSKPWGTEGYVVKASSSNYFGTEVTVKKEAKTRRATWVLIAVNGKELGWIDKAALKKLNPTKRVVVIDAGHGGTDPGAQTAGVKEKDLNLKVAKKVRAKLVSAGYEVIMTRTTDVFVALSERARIANISSADIFVSIHTNSFNSISKGIETFSYNGSGNAKNLVVANDPDRLLKSSLLSEAIQDALLEETGAYDRGDKEANFHVIRETGMAAVLTEMGFIDNASERSKLVNNNYQGKIADGIVQGIKNYFSIFK